MFAYLRFVSIISFFLVLAVTFLIGMYFRSVAATGIIQETVQQSNISLTNFFTRSLWEPNESVFDHLDPDPQSWFKNPQFHDFAHETSLYIRTLPAIKVNLYTANKIKFLSSSPHSVTFNKSIISRLFFSGQDDGLSMALAGKANSKIFTSASFFDKDQETTGSVIQTFVPIIDPTASDKPQAVMEIITDITTPWKRLIYFQFVGTSGIFAIFTMLYGLLFHTSARAERIIERQHEANTELAAAKSKAEAESIEKSKFLANISHELRTPLNAIIGFSAIIKDEVSGPIGSPLYRDYINDIHTSGSHLLSLINDILDYSKASADKLQVESVDVDVTKTIKTCLRLVAPRAEEAKVELKEILPPNHIILKTDPKRMKQVFLNLLSNSIKFTPEGGNVTLSAQFDEDSLILQVSDTGIGIADKDISKAMSTFGQVDSTLSRKYEGTGLGLPLTKKLTELMGGKFRIDSELGLGTTVTLTFPYTSPERTVDRTAEKSNEPA